MLAVSPLVLLASARVQRANSALIWLVAPLLIGAIVLALVALRAYRRERAQKKVRTARAIERFSPGQQIVTTTSQRSQEVGAVVTMVALDLSQHEAPQLPMPVLSQAATKLCRTCRREYRTALTVCPFDQTKLVTIAAANEALPRDDYLDTRRTLMRCDQCERQYDLDAKFCPFDGEPLSAAEEEDVRAYYDGEMICPECDERFDEDAFFCPDDGNRLHPAEPNVNHQAFGDVPLVICPECHHEYPYSVSICPSDGRELLTLVGRKTGGFPRRGLGSRQRICPKCGDRYGNDVSFCALDGAKLLQMN